MRSLYKNRCPLILALDIAGRSEALALADSVKGVVDILKVGLELFSACGPGVVEDLKDEGFEVFLDLKMNDIPNTVARACASVLRLEPLMITLHTMGGRPMMEAAVSSMDEMSRKAGLRKPCLLGVTVLTSLDTDALNEIGVPGPVEKQVLRAARLAVDSGLDGIVSSPRELELLRDGLGKDPVLVTPGVRPAGFGSGDQKRVATPGEAIEAGADYFVIGRPVAASEDPGPAAEEILAEIGWPG